MMFAPQSISSTARSFSKAKQRKNVNLLLCRLWNEKEENEPNYIPQMEMVGKYLRRRPQNDCSIVNPYTNTHTGIDFSELCMMRRQPGFEHDVYNYVCRCAEGWLQEITFDIIGIALPECCTYTYWQAT